jgi:hypothetical protein
MSPVMLFAAELAANQLPLSCAVTPSAQPRINTAIPHRNVCLLIP